MNLYPVLLSIAAFASTFLGGLLATKYRDQVGRFAAFSAGVLIAVPLFDLLSEANENNPPAVSLVLSLAGFLLIFVITRFLNV